MREFHDLQTQRNLKSNFDESLQRICAMISSGKHFDVDIDFVNKNGMKSMLKIMVPFPSSYMNESMHYAPLLINPIMPNYLIILSKQINNLNPIKN
jgi:hypothetical protein